MLDFENSGLVKVNPDVALKLAKAARKRIDESRSAAVDAEALRQVALHEKSWIRRLFRRPVKTVADIRAEWAEFDKVASTCRCSPLITSKIYWLREELLCKEVIHLATMSNVCSGDAVLLSPAQVQAIGAR